MENGTVDEEVVPLDRGALDKREDKGHTGLAAYIGEQQRQEQDGGDKRYLRQTGVPPGSQSPTLKYRFKPQTDFVNHIFKFRRL